MIPKFRVWSEEHQKMLYVWQITRVDNGGVQICASGSKGREYITIYDQTLGKNLKIMQSSGLFDSQLKPVEIYKDDIVKRILPNGAVLIGVVEFVNGMFLVDGIEAISSDCVVIGNIHEHPHLVEAGHD